MTEKIPIKATEKTFLHLAGGGAGRAIAGAEVPPEIKLDQIELESFAT